MNLESKIRNIQDFPKPGIGFKDITTLLKDGDAFKEAIDKIVENLKDKDVDYIVGPEARGFLLGAPVAYALGVGFVPIRKPGKLPAEVVSFEYDLEYGTDKIEMHKDSIEEGKKVAIIDDLLATGGTVEAATKLIESLGGEIVSIQFLIELEFLNGKDKLKGYDVESIIKY